MEGGEEGLEEGEAEDIDDCAAAGSRKAYLCSSSTDQISVFRGIFSYPALQSWECETYLMQ